MRELNGKRLIVQYAGDVWEVQDTPVGCIALGNIDIIPVPASWVLIRNGITISITKDGDGESLREFQDRLLRGTNCPPVGDNGKI